MTVDPYIGSAGGQPRLFIPTMGQFQDPSVETAMNVILRWANSLLLGTSSPGALLQYGFYNGSVVGSAGTTNPVPWTAVDSSFSYTSGSGLIGFPTNSVNLLTVRLDEAFPAGIDPVTIVLSLLGNSGANTLSTADFTAGLTSSNSKAYDSETLTYIFRTNGPFAAYAPLQTEAVIGGFNDTVTARLFILSWSLP
jgi:hypothetical protein